MKIKVCGITQSRNMIEIASLLPDFMGFIFYPPSPRDITNIIDKLPLDDLPPSIKKIAVVVDIPLRRTIQLIEKYKFDLIQLHGNESPGFCREIQKYTQTIKAFGINKAFPDNLDLYDDSCDFYLFDTKGDKPGGTGTAFEHSIIENYRGNKPFYISGGIDNGMVDKIKKLNNPMLFAVDINSRFENAPGIKDLALIKKFITEIRK